jgi:hypothetical protein
VATAFGHFRKNGEPARPLSSPEGERAQLPKAARSDDLFYFRK